MSRGIVFMASFAFAHVLLLVQRAVGINWDFHPDAVMYIEEFDRYTDGWSGVPNNVYYYLSALFRGSAWALLEVNIAVYSLTNAIGYAFILEKSKEIGLSRKVTVVLTATFLIQVYRAHLAIHVLKDTLVIAALLAVVILGFRRGFFAFVLLVLLRVSSIIYLSVFLRRKGLLIVGLFLVFSVFLMPQELSQFISSRNEADMGGRDSDTVPNFSEYGQEGSFIRAVLWPLLLLTGGFFVLSPGFMFFPIALELLVARIGQLYVRSFGASFVAVMFALSAIAITVNSFTAFLRYGYPLVALWPILFVSAYGVRR